MRTRAVEVTLSSHNAYVVGVCVPRSRCRLACCNGIDLEGYLKTWRIPSPFSLVLYLSLSEQTANNLIMYFPNFLPFLVLTHSCCIASPTPATREAASPSGATPVLHELSLSSSDIDLRTAAYVIYTVPETSSVPAHLFLSTKTRNKLNLPAASKSASS